MEVHQQHHGYLRGHQLLASSVKLDRPDQELIDRLSDIAGSIHSGPEIPSYLTGYPLPSGRFFVFARTWYDAAAQRTGCVLTHSLLVPLQAWSSAASASSVREFHRPFPHGDQATLQSIKWDPAEIDYLPPEVENDSPELIEALFLEKPAPVLWIAHDVENALLRIVDALWPSFRGRFAFQSFALKPRFLGERPFDLMAAPRTSRGRFADWPGRRVEGIGQPRHAWTSQLSREIFQAPKPSLSRVDPLGILSSEGASDQANLRLSLLWNDLGKQSVQNSSASLGMLDILAASPIAEENAKKLLESVVLRALKERTWTQFPSGPGKFMELLFSKLDGLPTSPRLASPLRLATRDVILDDPSTAYELVDIAAPSPNHSYQSLIEDAFLEAAGQSSSPEFAKLWLQLDENRFCKFLRRQPHILDIAFDDDALATGAANRLAESFSSLPPEVQARLRAALPDRLGEETASLLGPLLRQAGGKEYKSIATRLTNHVSGTESALMGRLLETADTSQRRTVLRGIIAESSLSRFDKGKLLASLLRPTTEELAWLIADHPELVVATSRAAKWTMGQLAEVIDSRPDVAERFIGALIEQDRASDAITLFERWNAPLNRKLSTFETIADDIPNALTKSALEDLVRSAFPLSSAEDGAVLGRLLKLKGAVFALESIGPRDLSELLFPDRRAEAATLNQVLAFLISQPAEVRPVIARSCAKIVDRLTSHQLSKLDKKVFANWARLLDQVADLDEKATISAAANTLQFAVAHGGLPVSEIVKASFLMLYPIVKSDRRSVRGGIFTPSIDRPTALRNDVADAYYRNSWPPRDLAFAAERLGIGDQVFTHLEKQWSGTRYLRRMLADLDPRRSKEERQARKRLRAFT